MDAFKNISQEQPVIIDGKPLNGIGSRGTFPEGVVLEIFRDGIRFEHSVNQSEGIWIAWLMLSSLPEGTSRNIDDLVRFTLNGLPSSLEEIQAART